MSLKYMIQALDTKVGNSTRKLVLLKLADQANDDGICWPSHKTIATAVECDPSTVKRHLKSLQDDGIISVKKRTRTNGSDTSNVYQLNICEPGGVQNEPGGVQNELGGGAECPTQNLSIEPKKDTNVSKKKDEDIEKVYHEYPKHVAKGQALKAIRSALKKVDIDTLIQATKEFAESQKGRTKKYIPNPATWYNAERWLDDRSEWHSWKDNDKPNAIDDTPVFIHPNTVKFPDELPEALRP